MHRNLAATALLLVLSSAVACVPGPVSSPTATGTPHPPTRNALPAPTSTAIPAQPLGTDTRVPSAAQTPSPAPTLVPELVIYRNMDFGISLEHPVGWGLQASQGTKYAGEDGFFQLSAISGAGASLDQVAEGEAYHRLQPYGSTPTTEVIQVQGHDARLIWPSADQPQPMQGQAALVVALPWLLEVSGARYDFLVLWADQSHIRQLAKTLRLIEPTPTATPTTIPSPTPLPACAPLVRQSACWTMVGTAGSDGSPGTAEPTGYLVYLPNGYAEEPSQNWPLILFLHGSDERGHDPRILTRQGLPRLMEQGHELPAIVVSPQCPPGEWWWPRTRMLVSFLDWVGAEYAVDSSRVYLTGLSMGAYGTWALAYRYPGRFAAIAPVAGGYYDGTESLPEDACVLSSVPIWAFHGAQDTTVKPAETERIVDALRACGANVRFTLYPEAGHAGSWELAYGDPELYDWLLQQALP